MTSLIHKEIEKLKQRILALVAQVEENVRMSVQALENLDTDLAEQVIRADLKVDQLEVDFEEDCLKILALFQPVATDLRFIVAALKINSDLERISDLAVNIAERARFLVTRKHISIPFDFSVMTDKVQDMLRTSINALVRLDAKKAYSVCKEDDEVDALHREMYVIVQKHIHEFPEDTEEIMHFLSISRHLERIADHATNIAEDIIYMIDGDIVRHHIEDFVHLKK